MKRHEIVGNLYTFFFLFASPRKKGNRFINIQKVIVKQLWWLLVLEVSIEAKMSIRADLLNVFVSSRTANWILHHYWGKEKPSSVTLGSMQRFHTSTFDCMETESLFWSLCTFTMSWKRCHTILYNTIFGPSWSKINMRYRPDIRQKKLISDYIGLNLKSSI